MVEPLFCDRCGLRILRGKDNFAEWYSYEDDGRTSTRVARHIDCYIEEAKIVMVPRARD